MASTSDFMRRMGALGTRVTRNADKVVRRVVLAVDQTVVLATPVDTGRARANWIAALNAPAEAATAETDRSGRKPIQQAGGVAASYDGDHDVAVHITNNLPYIGALDAGSSAQAPIGFVRSAVRAGVDAVKGARLLDS